MSIPPADLDDIPDLPDDVDLLGHPSAAAAPGAGAAPAPEGDRPLRALDKAPTHLRLAAMIVVVGAFIPFMGHGGGWMSFAAAKVVALIGAWMWYTQVKFDWGPPFGGVLGSLARLQLGGKKKEEEKPKRRRQEPAATPSPMAHPPTVLQILAFLVAFVVGCVVLPFVDPTEGMRPAIASAEVGIFAWAAFTWVHIFAYERWGHFNPLFPLMFLGIVFAGVARIVAGIGELGEPQGWMAALGGAIVAVGGGLAAYTIVEALREAKREGDEKKRAAAEARKSARKSRGGSARG